MRVSKKDIDKDFPRPRQRLLTNNKRETCVNYESGKRSRLSTMPYMNTRSVTRKMYNVGATYQAPTRKDETEWREWPVHGMHERPVFHPQVNIFFSSSSTSYFVYNINYTHKAIIEVKYYIYKTWKLAVYNSINQCILK